MKLKKLEIHGFKSFADKTEILFNDGITGIVGPNGSGKSNIGDAVRWVLGEQNARILRGSRMEDVIFGGTALRKPANYCEVTLLFDNEDQALRSNYSEVQVTRRVYRNGESEYYLNRTQCRLKDVLELFRDTGIGREGYSLIGQGRIDEILSAKSDDRRQVFEEAAGVMTYRFRKEEAERKLERTRDNLSRVNDIIAELEGRIEPLSRQAETAREYLNLSERLKELEVRLFVLRYGKYHARIDDLNQTIAGLKEAIGDAEKALNEKIAQRDAAGSELEKIEEKLDGERAAQKQTDDLTREAENSRQKLEANRESITQQKEQLAAVHGQNRGRRAQEEELFRSNEASAAQQREAVQTARDALAQAREKLDAALLAASEKEEELDRHKNRLLDAVNRISDVKNQQARQQAVHAQMVNRLEEIVFSRKEMAEREEELRAQLKEAQAKYDEENETVQALSEETAQNGAALNALIDRLRADTEKAQQMHLELETARSRLRLLTEMSREMEGYQQSVRQALRYGKNGNGACDVVAKLIRVPAAYETAIDMVLGAALQNIVTEDENAAKRMIDYLRNNRLGRATFLPITTVRSRTLTADEKRLLGMRGCIGVASDLINYDEKYRGVIENLLGRTVIAEDLSSGIEIMRAGRHAFRLVTLAGDVMHSGGSMTGGTAARSNVSLLGREREISELTAGNAAAEKKLASLRDEIAALRQKRDADLADYNELQERFHQEEIGLAREQEHLDNAKEALRDHLAALQRTTDAEQQLKSGIEALEEDLKKVGTLTEDADVNREQMEQETADRQQALYHARGAAEEAREAVQQAERNLADAEHVLDMLGRDARNQRQELERLDREEEGLAAKIREKEAELKETEKLLEEADKHTEEMRSRLRKQTELVDELEMRRRSTGDLQRQLMSQTDSLRAEYDQNTAREHRLELSLSKTENDLNNLSDHMFNTYELTYAQAAEIAAGMTEPFDVSSSDREAAELRRRIREMGAVNVSAIEEYAATKERYDMLTGQREDLNRAQEDLNQLITRLLRQMEGQFVQEFEKLNAFFSVTFTRLFGGGQAELRLTDPADALNCGIEIIAQPPGKKLQMLSLLSGGERALTAIAILFAMLKLKPTPFCILDEIEAALDEANIGYFADYLAEYKTDTQFVVVTHRKGTMERCDALYGVAMQEHGVSRMVSVDLRDYE